MTNIALRMLSIILKQKIELLKKLPKYSKSDDVNESYENGHIDGKISAFSQIINIIKE